MIIFPAIDLVGGKAVRLFKGDYNQMTVYSNAPSGVAMDFVKNNCNHIHLVDLEGARDGGTPNFKTVTEIKEASNAFCEIGGGIRSMEVVEKYVNAGLDRVIIGTAAVKDEEFLKKAADKYADKLCVGVDIKDGFVAVKGWLENSGLDAFEFAEKLQKLGIKTIICTDISKDGAMKGTNLPLYTELSRKFSMNITASGGVSSMEDVKNLRKLEIYGAIIGKAYYEGAINLKEAVEAAK